MRSKRSRRFSGRHPLNGVRSAQNYQTGIAPVLAMINGSDGRTNRTKEPIGTSTQQLRLAMSDAGKRGERGTARLGGGEPCFCGVAGYPLARPLC